MSTLHGQEIKVGDKVFSNRFAEGTVIDIWSTDPYPIKVTFSDDSCIFSYTETGLFSDVKRPDLFWQPFEIPAHAFQKPEEPTRWLYKNYLGDSIVTFGKHSETQARIKFSDCTIIRSVSDEELERFVKGELK